MNILFIALIVLIVLCAVLLFACHHLSRKLFNLEQQQPRWIACKDRVPSMDYTVLCCDERGWRFIAIYNHDHQRWEAQGGVGKIRWWMELPHAPEEARRKH